MKKSWSLQDVWNNSLKSQQWPVKPRNYIRASEIGYPMLDRYLKMMGEEPTNPFDDRILRKFQAGHVFEWIVGLVLKRAGLFQETQTEVKITGKDHLTVLGHLDFIAGGKPNMIKAGKAIMDMKLPFGLNTVALEVIKWLEKKYPDGMEETIYEVKTVNSLVFWRQFKSGMDKAYPHHQLQLYTYMKALKASSGHLIYISKDDLMLAEVEVKADEELEHKWHQDVQTITSHYNNKQVPQREQDIVWNGEKKKFEANWLLSRSLYFDKITGIKKEKWEEQVKRLVNRLNYRIKKATKEYPKATSLQLRNAINPYLESELKKIYENSQTTTRSKQAGKSVDKK